MKPSSPPSPNTDFNRVLAEIRAPDNLADDDFVDVNFTNSAVAGAFIVPSEETQARAGAASWEEALAWIAEEDDSAAGRALADQLSSETIEAIAEELRLNEVRTHEGLNMMRRAFMWRNHPDRQHEKQRIVATRRVAIANMLIDRAHMLLARDRHDQD